MQRPGQTSVTVHNFSQMRSAFRGDASQTDRRTERQTANFITPLPREIIKTGKEVYSIVRKWWWWTELRLYGRELRRLIMQLQKNFHNAVYLWFKKFHLLRLVDFWRNRRKKTKHNVCSSMHRWSATKCLSNSNGSVWAKHGRTVEIREL